MKRAKIRDDDTNATVDEIAIHIRKAISLAKSDGYESSIDIEFMINYALTQEMILMRFEENK